MATPYACTGAFDKGKKIEAASSSVGRSIRPVPLAPLSYLDRVTGIDLRAVTIWEHINLTGASNSTGTLALPSS